MNLRLSAARCRLTIESRRSQLRYRGWQQGRLAQLRPDQAVIVFVAQGGSESGVIRLRLAASASVALRRLAIAMNPLAVLRAPPVLDEQRVKNRRNLGAKTQQSHPYREVLD